MMIIVWRNPTAIFILIGARTTEQSQVKHELLFCARVLLGNIRRIFFIKKSRILECLLIVIGDRTYDTKEIVEVTRHLLLRIPFNARYGLADLQHCSADV